MFDMNCFNLDKRILVKGQWVDVKDTVEQWLDAQVMEVSEDNKMVKDMFYIIKPNKLTKREQALEHKMG